MAQDAKKSFVLYYDYRQHLSLLSNEERGQLLMALLDYGEFGDEPELEGAALMAFSFIRAQMDRDAAKYAETVRKRREAGKQGGRPPKSSESNEKQNETKKANGFEEKQTKAKKPDTDTVTDNVTVTVTDNVTVTDINNTPLPPLGGKPDALEQRFGEFWSAYPKKVGKKAALTAWKRLKPNAFLFERIMKAVTTAKNSEQWKREGGRFIPNPSTWINQGRWDDEPLPPVYKNGSQFSHEVAAWEEWELKQLTKHQVKTAGNDEKVRAKAEALKEQLSDNKGAKR